MRCALLALTITALAAAQPVIRVTTRLVDLSVIARDGKGPVADLTKEEFTLLDNGVARPIAFFSMNSAKVPAVRPAPLPANVFTNRSDARGDSPARLTVFVVDQLNTEFETQVRVRQQLLKAIPKLGPRDRAAIWVMTDRLKRVQDFTGDILQLTSAVKKIGTSLVQSPDRPSAAASGAPPGAADVFADATANTAAEAQQYYRMQLTNDLMRDLGNALARVPGRKNVVWLSAAFPINMPIGPGGPETEYVSQRLTGTGTALAKGNAALYPVDARGLSAPSGGQNTNSFGESELQRHRALDEIALGTGGRAIYDANDLATAIGEAIDDAEVSYTIGFYPADDAEDGRYHHVQISVRRRGVDLRYRAGYVAGDAQSDSAIADGREALFNALANPLEESSIGIMARVDPSDPKRPGWLRMTISVAAADLTPDGSIDLTVAQRAANGRDIAAVHAEVPVKDTATMRREVQLSPGVAELRIVVYDHSSGRVGSVNVPVSR